MNSKTLMQLIIDNALSSKSQSIQNASQQNAFHINDLIGAQFSGNSESLISALQSAAEGPFTVYLNSPGGDVFEARTMAAAIAAHPSPVDVVITGVCASAATYIALSAKNVRMVEGGLMMIHEGMTIGFGNKGDFLKKANLLDKIDGTIIDTYAQKTNISPEKIHAWMKAETWFTAQEALDAGFIDAIDSNTQNTTSNHWNLSAYANAPKPSEQKTEEPDLTAQVAQQLQLNRNRLRLLDQAL